MLHQPASHGLIDLEVQATGDLQIDDHHTNEDGDHFGQALGKHWARKGIVRFGTFLSLDEALIQVALDFLDALTSAMACKFPPSGLVLTTPGAGVLVAVVNHSQMTLHSWVDGINSHHIIEATFKAFARSTGCGNRSASPVRFPVLRGFVAQAAL